MTTKNKLTDAQLKRMKDEYMQYKNPTQIAKAVRCARTTVVHHIKKWDVEREMKKAELFQTMSEAKQVEFTNMTQATITIMNRALAGLANRTEEPTMREAVMASDILATLDKITRLDDGNPTDIISKDKALSIIEVKRKIASDPFSVTYNPEELDEAIKEDDQQ